jgi:large subunit ribosomal protein L20
MPRVKGGQNAIKRRRNVLSQAKGFRFGRGNKEKLAREALKKAAKYSFNHRKDKKSERRRLWQTQINGAVREFGLSYSKFIGKLKSKNIEVDRKILSDLAQNNPESFKRVMDTVTK